MHIQVANLNLNVIEVDLQRLFTPFGEIMSVKIIRDKLNSRSSGKAVIDMPVEKQAEKAILSLDGSLIAGKKISVIKMAGDEPGRNSSAWLTV